MSIRQKILVAAAVVAMFNLMLVIVFGDNGLVELSRLRAKEQLMVQRNEILAGENVDLYRTIGRLKNDPVYIESVARNELGMVGKNDIVMLRSGSRGQRN
jgi:cell division protein FtsB